MTDLFVDLIAHTGEDFQSTSIDTIAYDLYYATLYIDFVSGDAIYGYEGVSESTYNLLLNADSLNRFWRDHISGQYDSTRYDGCDLVLNEPLAEWERELLTPVEFKVGDRVMVNYVPESDWNGEGVVTESYRSEGDASTYIVEFDRPSPYDGGGFYAYSLSLINDVQPDTKWLTPEGEALGEANSAAATSRWTIGYLLSVNGNEQPFTTDFFDAASEADALLQFNAEIAKAYALFGSSTLTVKVQKVTHYFD